MEIIEQQHLDLQLCVCLAYGINLHTNPSKNIGIYMQSVLRKKDDFIPLGSQKTPRVPFKVKLQCMVIFSIQSSMGLV